MNLDVLGSAVEDPGYGIRHSLALDFNLQITGAFGVVHEQREVRSIHGHYGEYWPETSLGVTAMDWDGVRWLGNDATIAAAGDYQLVLTIDVMRFELEGDQPIVTDVYERIAVIGLVSVLEPTSACLAWVRYAPSFVESGDSIVVNDGDTRVRPQVTWREEKARRLLGNLEQRVGGEPYSDVVKRFVATYGALLGWPTTPSIDALETQSSVSGPDGLTLVRLDQVIPGTSVQAYERGLSAMFDGVGRLVRLAGGMATELPEEPPQGLISHHDAIEVVKNDLMTQGRSLDRGILVSGEVVVESLGGYELAAVIGADIVESDLNSDSYEYVVSLANGAILDFERTTSAASANITKWDRDPNLLIGYNNSGAPLIGTYDWQQIEDRVQVRDDGSNIRLRDIEAGGVIAKLEEKNLWNVEPLWPTGTTDIFQTPPTNGLDVIARLEALTVYAQIQRFWDQLSPYTNGGWQIDIQTNIPNLTSGDQPVWGVFRRRRGFGNDRIQFDRDAFPTPPISGPSPPEYFIHVGTHEFFHAFDRHTAGVRTSDRGDGDRRMPGAIKEGMGDWAMVFADPRGPSRDTSLLAKGIICFIAIFSADARQECRAWQDYYAKPGFISLLRRPTMTESGVTSIWPDWPDCRANTSPRVVDSDEFCPVVVTPPPGPEPNTWHWKGTPFVRSQEYSFVALVMTEAWEGTANTVYRSAGGDAADTFVADFPGITIRGFTMLDSRPSLVDLEDAILDSVTLHYSGSPIGQLARIGVQRAFDNHGIDAALRDFCAIGSNDDQCF